MDQLLESKVEMIQKLKDEYEASGPAPDLDKLDPQVKQLLIQGTEAPPVRSMVRHLVDNEDEDRETQLIESMMKDIEEFKVQSARGDFTEERKDEDGQSNQNVDQNLLEAMEIEKQLAEQEKMLQDLTRQDEIDRKELAEMNDEDLASLIEQNDAYNNAATNNNDDD